MSLKRARQSCAGVLVRPVRLRLPRYSNIEDREPSTVADWKLAYSFLQSLKRSERIRAPRNQQRVLEPSVSKLTDSYPLFDFNRSVSVQKQSAFLTKEAEWLLPE